MASLIKGPITLSGSQILASETEIDLTGLTGDTFTNFSQFNLQLPSAGTYIICSQFNGRIRVGGVVDTVYISARIVKRVSNSSVEIPMGRRTVIFLEFPVANENYINTDSYTLIYAASGPDLISVDFATHGSQIIDMAICDNIYGVSYMSYFKIA